MAYQQLPIETHDLADLALDLDNYRIPVRSTDENAALNYLYAEEDVFEAAKMIVRDGYFDNEVPIVVREDNRYTVLEGNRRVSALKIMADPTLVPVHEHAIRDLLKRYATEAEDLPTAIRVIVAPSREAAKPHIARLHTTVPKKRWSRDQQAKYYYSLLGPTTTVQDIRQQYPGVSVVRFIKMAAMRQFLSGARFRDHTLHEYVRGQGLTMSAFEYAFKNVSVASAIGVTFDSDGLLMPTSMSAERIGSGLEGQHLAALEYLMGEFRAGRLNTRSLHFRKDTPEQTALLARLLGAASTDSSDAGGGPPLGDLGGSGAGPEGRLARPELLQDGSSEWEMSSGAPTPRGPNHPDTRDHLDLAGLDYATHATVNLQSRYHELRQLSLTRTPVATSMLLRAVLESTIKFHFEPTSTPATGELKDCLRVVKAAYGSMRSLRTAIDTVDSADAKRPGSVQWFNHVAHNADAAPNAAAVRSAFSLVNPLLRHLLRPAPGRTSP